MGKYKVKDIQNLAHIKRKSKKLIDGNGNLIIYEDGDLNDFLLDSKEYHLLKSLDGSWLKGMGYSLFSLISLTKVIYDVANLNPDKFILESIADEILILLSVASGGLAIKELYPKINHLVKAKKYERLSNLYNSDITLK